VIFDSIQAIAPPDLQSVMENFPILFHEPYYRHYITDDWVVPLEEVGFKKVQTEGCFVYLEKQKLQFPMKKQLCELEIRVLKYISQNL